ncbi:MAG TPA: Lrp/AsnC family transcriptional regulator [Solirubrobacterales bacterium]|nr:Lrp/AsnC family transcriptional regulator [Solirubrobacterales bacterium]
MRRRSAGGDAQLVLDEIDRKIISELQQDGRQAYGRVAKAVGLSEAAARQRAQRMVEQGVIRIVAVPDPMLLGLPVGATLGIRGTGDLSPLIEVLERTPSVDFVVSTAGGYDLLAEVQCRDHEDLSDLINTTIRTVPGVSSVDSFVYLKYYKQTYSWPPNRGVLEGTDPRAVSAPKS